MWVSIHAIDAEEDPGDNAYFMGMIGGKKSRVKPCNFEIVQQTDGLFIRAKDSEDFGTGDRGGSVKTVNRRLNMFLTSYDLQKIVDAAVQKGLLANSVPCSSDVARAMQDLRRALSQIGVQL